FELNPPSAYFGNLQQGQSAERVISIKNNADEEVSVTLAEDSVNDPFEVELEEVVPGREYSLTVKVTAKKGESYAGTVIKLSTSLESHPEFALNAAVRILPDMEVRPPHI